MKIYVINGAPGCGKTTFETIIQTIMGEDFCKMFSTIDFVKSIAKECGWDGTKDLKNRKFLSDLKDLLTEWNDVPLKDIQQKIRLFKDELDYYDVGSDAAVFIDCREPQEIEKLKNTLGAKTVIIRRESAEQELTSNHADADVLNYHYDITINNNNGLQELKLAAMAFLEGEKLHNWNKSIQLSLF